MRRERSGPATNRPQASERDPDLVVVYMQVRDAPDSDGGRPVDPVCRRELEPEFAAGKLIHHGVEYRFCSLRCARTFAAHPEEFVA